LIAIAAQGAMQAQLFCATCATPLAFNVPELTGNRWHVLCRACGNRTVLEANSSEPEALATFSAAGVYSSAKTPLKKPEIAGPLKD